jgi:dolichyldiphosphatase
LHYHSVPQVLAGYVAGIAFGSLYFTITEYIPLYYPQSLLAKTRSLIESIWTGIGGVGGYELSSSTGGWGEGWMVVGGDQVPASVKVSKAS